MAGRFEILASVVVTVGLMGSGPPTVAAQSGGAGAQAVVGATTAEGVVFWDQNGNGEQDPRETGAAGIRLNALHRATVTDENGQYSIRSDQPFVTVSVSFPSGTWPTAGWFRRMTQERQANVDFGLRRDAQELPFVFVHFTDPHDQHPITMPKVREECEGLPLEPRFYICTGDMRSGEPTVRNVPDLEESYGAIGRNFEAFGAPLFMVPGNHDTVGFAWSARPPVTEEEANHPLFGDRCWERYVCPGHWSFSYGGVHFIGVQYAEYVEGKWDDLSPETLRWIKDDLGAVPAGERSILCAHRPGLGQVVVDLGMTLGLFGDSHTEGQYCAPGSEEPMFPPNVLVGGLCQTGRWGQRRYMAQDGRPMGYRIIVVEQDRVDTFYRAFDEPHTIMVNRPRRFAAIKGLHVLVVRGQFFDPHGTVSDVRVALADRQCEAAVVRRRLWGDFEATVDLGRLAEGFYDLTVTTVSPEGSYTLAEPYLLLTGRRAGFSAEGPATLTGQVRRLNRPCMLLVNGKPAGLVRPEDQSKTFSVEVPAGSLDRLNRVSLMPENGADPVLTDVRLQYDGRQFVDQHRVFAWGFDSSLRAGRALYFDLAVPGPALEWRVTSDRP